MAFLFCSSRRRHTRCSRDWSSDVCSSDLLDSLEGRIWLQMEWRALEHAFWQQGEDRKHDGADAVYFWNYRRPLFSLAENNENALEMNEGVGGDTGFKGSTAWPAGYAVAWGG